MSDIGRKVIQWQQCPGTSLLLCSMDTDHPPMEWIEVNDRGFLQCPEETCGFIRYNVNPQVLTMVHGERHHGCYYGGMEQ